MKRNSAYGVWLIPVAVSLMMLTSCEKFLNPDQELHITEDQLFDDWYEYRSVEMGMYGLQQQLVEQLFILGELRGDLLEITPSATADMVEVYNFNISRNNKYASPINLFKLISACNNFIAILEEEHPEVMDPDSPVNNYDRLYGEALCMRAWAYFQAVRIYGKVPFIHESLTTIEEIESYIEAPGTYIDSVHIAFSRDGYYNDTTFNEPIVLEKNYFDTDLVVDHFTNQLENDLKAVGVNHYIVNDDNSWEVTIWNDFAKDALLGQMYLTQGDLAKAGHYFLKIMTNPSESDRYHIDISISLNGWRTIFSGINNKEHIYTIWFDKTYFQQNAFQSFFEAWGPHNYMLKPSYQAILNWESTWRYFSIRVDQNNPEESELINRGVPTDFWRGLGSSYLYIRNGVPITEEEYQAMCTLRAEGDDRSSRTIMEDMDTVVFKYSVNRNSFDQDANYIIYRAAGIHLWMAEVFTYWAYLQGDIVRPSTTKALGILNDGSWSTLSANRPEVGIRGRVGLGSGTAAISVGNINFVHDPFTNEIIDYIDLTGDFLGKQEYLEEKVLEEKARELAFEGERFYDLMRVAKRRNDPSFLAEMVSASYPIEKRDQIYNHLLDETNWYIPYFEE